MVLIMPSSGETSSGPRIQRIGAYAVCLADGGSILLSRYTSGTWTLPGGGVEHGEHPEEAVIRELAEETGYAARVRNLIGIHSNTWTTLAGQRVHSVNVMYRVEIVDGELRYEVDGTSDMAAWVSRDQLTRYAHTKIVDVALKQTTDWH
ncbi:NUDIX hydrolase [Actinopolymorpha pittospori]|uniref:ADP-ribose pyrophosphatase YjhB (NUDIX family) n=1 Tax=Actinopolymorpha pittospori TaxID=648752 RepID=A0A927MT59_9ACTN|nr:NUDIX domain-containing protein [Actinopolymorpha pittospori]MBE1605714.1 ADP-ribose pyrophosphatase YjhB (NUDIX family) [Actinopolymorpha pittospori]